MKKFALLMFAITTLGTLTAVAGPGAASQPTDGIIRRGLPLSKKAALSVSEAIKNEDQIKDGYVKVHGTIKSVCKKKGCWFVIRDTKSQQKIRITSLGYKFFVPKDCEGYSATVEGQFESKTMSVAEGQHMADDKATHTGKKAEKVNKEIKEYRIASVGVELKK
jgi:hypothetical protein